MGFWLAAALAGLLSLAAALVAFTGGATTEPETAAPVVDEVAARNQRIAFYEERARADVLAFTTLNTLAFEYLQRAREVGDLGDYARAETAAQRSLEILPRDNLNGFLALASVRLVQHDYAAVLELSEKALVLKPSSAPALGLKGDAMVGLGRYDEADAAFQRMVDIEPALPALSRLAGLAMIRDYSFNAETFWKQAIDRSKDSPRENRAWARVQLGKLYFGRGELDKAARQYNEALKLDPDYAHANAGLASVMAAKGQWDESIALYTLVQARLPQPEYVIALGDVYAVSGHEKEARNQYQLIEAIDEIYRANGVNTDLQLALFYADHDIDLQRAVATGEAAYKAAPGVYAADAYAWALFKAGRVRDADVAMTDALRVQTPEARFYYHSGLIRRELGDQQGAIEHLEKALAINPYFSPTQAQDARVVLRSLKNGR